jgi:hypothetical protein
MLKSLRKKELFREELGGFLGFCVKQPMNKGENENPQGGFFYKVANLKHTKSLWIGYKTKKTLVLWQRGFS